MKDSHRLQEFQRLFAELQHRIANARTRSLAVVADAYAIRERILRARARRQGRPWSPEPFETFIKNRSNRAH